MLLLRGFSALLCALAAALVLTGTAVGAEPPRVLAVEFENDVNPVTADYLTGAIEQGEKDGYDAVVILMDTPGGLDSAMRDIIKKELESTVPVVVYVYPQGSRAASALRPGRGREPHRGRRRRRVNLWRRERRGD